jgi:hypothetical protein
MLWRKVKIVTAAGNQKINSWLPAHNHVTIANVLSWPLQQTKIIKN